jgi:hypothetical protein
VGEGRVQPQRVGDVAGTSGGFSSIAGAPITENPSGAGTNTLKAYGGGGGGSNNATVDGENGRGRSGGSGGGGI